MGIEHLKSEEIIDVKVGVNFNRLTAFSASTRMHDHDFCEFFFINHGKIIHKCNGKSEIVSEGQVVYIRPHDVHSFANAGVDCEMYNLAFRNQLLVKCANFAGNSIALKSFYEPKSPPVGKLNASEKKLLVKSLEAAWEELSTYQANAKTNFYIIILKLCVMGFPKINSPSANLPAWFEALCSKMKQKNNFIVGLRRMQKLAYCSPEHLCRSCRTYLGKSPTEFINELRVNYAACE